MNPLKRLLAHMTPEQKIAQMICFGAGGTHLDKEVTRFLEQYPFQNIGLFARNADSLEGLCSLSEEIQIELPKQCMGIPAMILTSYDEFSQLFDLPSLSSLAACGSLQDAFSLGRCVGQWVSSCKITHLLGPCHDCSLLPESMFDQLLCGLEQGGVSCIPALCECDHEIPSRWKNALLPDQLSPELVESFRKSDPERMLCCHIDLSPSCKGFAHQAVQLVKSGVDLFIQCDSRQEQTVLFRSLLHAVRENRISMERIDHAVQNILQSKINSSHCFENRESLHPLSLQLELRRIFRSSITMVQDLAELLPTYSKKFHRLLVIVPESLPCNLGEFLSMGFPETRVIYFPDSPQPQELQALYRAVDQSDLTICCLEPRPVSDAALSYFKSLSMRRPTIYIDPKAQPHTIDLPKKSGIILTYSTSDTAMQAASEVIVGKLRPEGVLPSCFARAEH